MTKENLQVLFNECKSLNILLSEYIKEQPKDCIAKETSSYLCDFMSKIKDYDSWVDEKNKEKERQKLRSNEIAELRSKPDSPLEDDEHIIYYCEDCIILTDSKGNKQTSYCLLYTSPSPRDQRGSRMPSSA